LNGFGGDSGGGGGGHGESQQPAPQSATNFDSMGFDLEGEGLNFDVSSHVSRGGGRIARIELTVSVGKCGLRQRGYVGCVRGRRERWRREGTRQTGMIMTADAFR
jgi:hypothetical protein